MKFDVSRLRRADQIIGGSAIAFFIFLFFFHWLGASSSSPLGHLSYGANGWHSFSVSRWIWIITIIVALLAVARTAGLLSFESPVQLSVAVAGLGALSTLLILYRIIHHPHGGFSESLAGTHISASYGIKIGIWLGLIASAALTYGGYLAMQDDGTSIADVREQASGAISNLQAPGSGSGEPASPSSPPPASESALPIPPPAAEEPPPVS
ncbi:MAG TPA: hypothetical protein VGG08_08485 [Solirubrobacteraceae bacterium]|jgi:hypothetical protein